MKRNAFTLIEMLIVIAIMAVLIALLVPAIDRVREEVRRSKCRAQLRGIGTALNAYAGEGNWKDRWPDCGRDPATSGPVDTKGSMWLLVKRGLVQPETFLCPSEEVSGVAGQSDAAIDSAGPFPRNAKNKVTISYSYQIPHAYMSGTTTMSGNPGRDHPNQTRLAVMADRSPFDAPSDATAPGAKLDKLGTWATEYNNLSETRRQKTTVHDYLATKWTKEERKQVNSSNHASEGQNVLYRDGHTEWCKSPLAGINFDNIYTRSTATSVTGRAVGTAPASSEVPFDKDDSCLRTVPRP